MQALQRNTSLIDFIVWARLSGITWWNKLGISHGPRGRGLFSTQSLQPNDIVLSVPLRSTFSFLNFEFERNFPLKVTPRDYGMNLPWWPDLDWGTFALVAWLTCKSLSQNPNTSPYISALPSFQEISSISARSDVPEEFSVMRSIARQSMRSQEYREVTEPLVKHTSATREAFDAGFEWLYTMVRSRAIPLWSNQGGHEAFRSTSYGSQASEDANRGDICCVVPMIDMINHSTARPNVAIGFPGDEVAEFIIDNSPSKRKDIEASESFCLPSVSSKAFIVVRTQTAIQPGEELLMDYNTFYGFDEEIFAAWFDTPLRDEGSQAFSSKGGMKYRMK